MKKFIKPLVLAAIASSLVGIASAVPSETHQWLSTIQMNSVLATAFETVGTQVSFYNPNIKKQQVFVVTTPAVCAPSAKLLVDSCWVGLRDVSLTTKAYATKEMTYNGKVYDVGTIEITPYIRFSYTKHTDGNHALTAQRVEMMPVQQQVNK